MSDLILRKADIDRFTATLEKLIDKANISLSVLIHRDGHLLASAGDSHLLDTTALSALVSASFSSMIAVANLVGEQEFATQHLAGKEKSVYIALADHYTFVVSVFDITVPLEPIRDHTEAYREELAAALQHLYNNEAEPFPDDDDEEDVQATAEEEVVDAEEAARREKDDGNSGKAVPRRLSYTGKADNAPRTDGGKPPERPKIHEPDGEDIDIEALAAAITSKKERDTDGHQVKSAPRRDNKQIVIDGEAMNVVSLRNKKSPKGKKTRK